MEKVTPLCRPRPEDDDDDDNDDDDDDNDDSSSSFYSSSSSSPSSSKLQKEEEAGLMQRLFNMTAPNKPHVLFLVDAAYKTVVDFTSIPDSHNLLLHTSKILRVFANRWFKADYWKNRLSNGLLFNANGTTTTTKTKTKTKTNPKSNSSSSSSGSSSNNALLFNMAWDIRSFQDVYRMVSNKCEICLKKTAYLVSFQRKIRICRHCSFESEFCFELVGKEYFVRDVHYFTSADREGGGRRGEGAIAAKATIAEKEKEEEEEENAQSKEEEEEEKKEKEKEKKVKRSKQENKKQLKLINNHHLFFNANSGDVVFLDVDKLTIPNQIQDNDEDDDAQYKSTYKLYNSIMIIGRGSHYHHQHQDEQSENQTQNKAMNHPPPPSPTPTPLPVPSPTSLETTFELSDHIEFAAPVFVDNVRFVLSEESPSTFIFVRPQFSSILMAAPKQPSQNNTLQFRNCEFVFSSCTAILFLPTRITSLRFSDNCRVRRKKTGACLECDNTEKCIRSFLTFMFGLWTEPLQQANEHAKQIVSEFYNDLKTNMIIEKEEDEDEEEEKKEEGVGNMQEKEKEMWNNNVYRIANNIMPHAGLFAFQIPPQLSALTPPPPPPPPSSQPNRRCIIS